MNAVPKDLPNAGKTSMKTIFGRKKVRKDGSEGKNISVESVENLQREDRVMDLLFFTRFNEYVEAL
jgi:DNA polymerase I